MTNISMDYLQQSEHSLPLPSPSPRGAMSVNHGMRFLSRDRPYPCHVCGKRFTQKAHLIIHKRTHTGEKPYACHICHKRFAQTSHLTVHKRVHTGEKPFFCNFCGMGFCRRPRLEAHVLQHMVKEGRSLPSGLKGDSLSNLTMVGLDGGGSMGMADRVNQESLDAAAQLMELKMKGGIFPQVKSEPDDKEDSSSKVGQLERRRSSNTNNDMQTGMGDGAIPSSTETGNDRLAESHDNRKSEASVEHELTSSTRDCLGSRARDGPGALLNFSVDDLEKQSSGLTELSELQKQTLSQSLLMSSPKGQQLSSLMASHSHHQMMSAGHAVMPSSGLTMTGLVRTNTRVSLIDFTAEDIMQHLLSRDDVKSCDFCCVVFRDPAMYYLHRSMHDKMDVRCCNLCGKLLKDKYDFTAHFLNKHT